MLGCWSRWGNKPWLGWLGFVKAMQHSIRDCSGRRHWTRVHYAAENTPGTSNIWPGQIEGWHFQHLQLLNPWEPWARPVPPCGRKPLAFQSLWAETSPAGVGGGEVLRSVDGLLEVGYVWFDMMLIYFDMIIMCICLLYTNDINK